MKTIDCFCEFRFEADIPDDYDLAKDTTVMDSVLDGTFLNITCPQCGKILKPEFPIRLFDKTKEIDIFFIPELDRESYFIKKLGYPIGDPKRITIGYPELVEKIKIIKAGLDDQVIEIVKFYILSKAEENDTSDEEIKIYFNQAKEKILKFHIEGLKKDEIAFYEIDHDVYEKVKSELPKKLKQGPYSEFLKPPYISLTKIYME